MSSIAIEISELHGKDDKKVKDLASFLKDRVSAEIDVTSSEITLSYKEKENVPSKAYLRVLLRKFLHKAELKEQFRVISSKENVFIIKEKKRVRVEEE